MSVYPTYRHTPSRRRPAAASLPPPLAPRWSRRGLAHDPVMTGTHVVAALTSGEVAAYGRDDGAEAWRVRLADAFDPLEPAREGAPLLHEDAVLVRVGGRLLWLDP